VLDFRYIEYRNKICKKLESGLPLAGVVCILFDKSCLWHISFHKKSDLRRILLIKIFFLNPVRAFGDAFHFKFLILSTNYLVVKMV